jgi:hypothetical protein
MVSDVPGVFFVTAMRYEPGVSLKESAFYVFSPRGASRGLQTQADPRFAASRWTGALTRVRQTSAGLQAGRRDDEASRTVSGEIPSSFAALARANSSTLCSV